MRTGNDRRRFRTPIVTGMVSLLIATHPLPATARNVFKPKTDWSVVEAIPVGTRAEVRLYKDRAPSRRREIRGHFHSASAQVIMLLLTDGQIRTLQKRNVSKVLTYRSRFRRYQGWLAMGITAGVIQVRFLANPSSDGDTAFLIDLVLTGIFTPLAGAIAFLATPEMASVYHVPIWKRTATADNFLEEESGPDRLRQQARHSLIRKGLPLDLSSLPGAAGRADID